MVHVIELFAKYHVSLEKNTMEIQTKNCVQLLNQVFEQMLNEWIFADYELLLTIDRSTDSGN